jgi:hypothetical protein
VLLLDPAQFRLADRGLLALVERADREFSLALLAVALLSLVAVAPRSR